MATTEARNHLFVYINFKLSYIKLLIWLKIIYYLHWIEPVLHGRSSKISLEATNLKRNAWEKSQIAQTYYYFYYC